MKKSNLNEEDYQKFRNGMKIFGIISIVIGLCLICYGIFCGKEYGPGFIVGGIFVLLCFGSLIFDSREFAAYLAQGSAPINKEVVKEIVKVVKEGLEEDGTKDAE